jgi:hypothetical protein
MRFAQFFAQDYQFDEYRGVTIPKHELLYRMVTGDKNAPRFPLMAVRWLTPPVDIAALVTDTSTSRFEAELFHFGDQPRRMAAELRLLAPGSYNAWLLTNNGDKIGELATVSVKAGHFARLEFELPSQQLGVLKIERSSPR